MGTFHVIILLIVLQVAWRQKCARLVQNGTIFSGGNFSMGFSKKRSARYHFRVSEANDACPRPGAEPAVPHGIELSELAAGHGPGGPGRGVAGAGRENLGNRRSGAPGYRGGSRGVGGGACVFHACVKMWLANQPEADGSAKQLAVSQAERRYQKLLTNAAQLMSEPPD